MATTTDLDVLKINYLTQAQYDTAKQAGTLNSDEIYMTPARDGGTVYDVTVDGVSVVENGVAEIDMPSVPTKVSDLTNDSGYITSSSVPTKVSQLTNDSGYITGYTDNKVAQSASTSSTAQPILFRNNVASGTGTSTEGVRYVNSVTVTPSTGTITATKVNGYTLAGACAKTVDTSISAASTSTSLPTSAAVASFVEGKGYLTSYTETDPTVPSWAKASSKPSYTASEVGAVPTSRTVNGKALSSNITLSASDVGALPDSTSIPSKTSDLTNDSGFITSLPSFQVRSVSYTYSPANLGNANTNLKTLIDADMPTGYRCLGIVGVTTNDIYVFVVAAYYGASNYSLQLKSTYEGARSDKTAVIYYLCTDN